MAQRAFELLGVTEGATQPEIRAALKRLGYSWQDAQLDGDRSSSANAKFREAASAFRMLSPPLEQVSKDAQTNDELELFRQILGEPAQTFFGVRIGSRCEPHGTWKCCKLETMGVNSLDDLWSEVTDSDFENDDVWNVSFDDLAWKSSTGIASFPSPVDIVADPGAEEEAARAARALVEEEEKEKQLEDQRKAKNRKKKQKQKDKRSQRKQEGAAEPPPAAERSNQIVQEPRQLPKDALPAEAEIADETEAQASEDVVAQCGSGDEEQKATKLNRKQLRAKRRQAAREQAQASASDPVQATTQVKSQTASASEEEVDDDLDVASAFVSKAATSLKRPAVTPTTQPQHGSVASSSSTLAIGSQKGDAKSTKGMGKRVGKIEEPTATRKPAPAPQPPLPAPAPTAAKTVSSAPSVPEAGTEAMVKELVAMGFAAGAAARAVASCGSVEAAVEALLVSSPTPPRSSHPESTTEQSTDTGQMRQPQQQTQQPRQTQQQTQQPKPQTQPPTAPSVLKSQVLSQPPGQQQTQQMSVPAHLQPQKQPQPNWPQLQEQRQLPQQPTQPPRPQLQSHQQQQTSHIMTPSTDAPFPEGIAHKSGKQLRYMQQQGPRAQQQRARQAKPAEAMLAPQPLSGRPPALQHQQLGSRLLGDGDIQAGWGSVLNGTVLGRGLGAPSNAGVGANRASSVGVIGSGRGGVGGSAGGTIPGVIGDRKVKPPDGRSRSMGASLVNTPDTVSPSSANSTPPSLFTHFGRSADPVLLPRAKAVGVIGGPVGALGPVGGAVGGVHGGARPAPGPLGDGGHAAPSDALGGSWPFPSWTPGGHVNAEPLGRMGLGAAGRGRLGEGLGLPVQDNGAVRLQGEPVGWPPGPGRPPTQDAVWNTGLGYMGGVPGVPGEPHAGTNGPFSKSTGGWG